MAKRSIHDDDLDDDLDYDPYGEGLRPGRMSQRFMVVVIAVVVIVAGVLGTFIYFNATVGAVTGVTLTEPSRSDDVFTFAYTLHTDHGLATGRATFLASVEGVTTYSHDFEVTPGGGVVSVKADDFIIGNGNYVFRLQFGGFEGKSNYTVGTVDHTNFIVTSMRVDTSLFYPDELQIGALKIYVNFYSDEQNNVYALSPPNTSITMKITKNGVQDGPVITQRVDNFPYKVFNVTPNLGPGNYSVNVTYTNNWVRSDSSFKTLYDENRTYVHNRPNACVSPTFYKATAANNYTVTLDGSCSTDDNGPITNFLWYFDFGEPVTNYTSPYETWTFPAPPPSKTYHCNLTVTDSGVPGVPNSGETWWVEFQVQVSVL